MDKEINAVQGSVLEFLLGNSNTLVPEFEKLKASIKTQKVRKGQILQSKGELSKFVYYVKKGLLRSYVIDDSGKEHIFMFAAEGWIISDPISITYNIDTDLFIDALENSEVEVFPKSTFEEYPSLLSNSDTFGMEKLLKRIAVLQKRVLMLMGASAKERYQHFIETYPDIVQRVPQKLIASYLGITPEALSKIRGNK